LATATRSEDYTQLRIKLLQKIFDFGRRLRELVENAGPMKGPATRTAVATAVRPYVIA